MTDRLILIVYTEQDWELLRSVSDDAEQQWHTDFAAFSRDNEENFERQTAAGLPIERVEIDVTRLIAWCREHDLPVTRATTFEYALWVRAARDEWAGHA